MNVKSTVSSLLGIRMAISGKVLSQSQDKLSKTELNILHFFVRDKLVSILLEENGVEEEEFNKTGSGHR